jgi:hypothetical protein
MALKPFSVRGDFSGRSTPVGGGPKLSLDKAEMLFKVFQRVNEEEVCICTIKSVQDRRDIKSLITIHPTTRVTGCAAVCAIRVDPLVMRFFKEMT